MILRVIINILFFSSTIKGDIRCHCNQPICVRSGYMCKSSGAAAACFLEHSGDVRVDGISDISRHGCIELLPQNMRDVCDKNLNHHHSHRHHSTNKSVICCFEDMCNYVKNVDTTNIKIQAVNNETQHGTYSSSSSNNFSNSIWFQVTVITVPIVGSLIIVLLIFIATKVLRQDVKRQNQITEIRKQRQFKAHLLLNGSLNGKQQHNNESDGKRIGSNAIRPEKNETNAKINDLEKVCDMSSSSPSNGTKLCNIINISYKDSNISKASDHHPVNAEKDTLCVKPLNTSLYNSLLTCGK